MLENVKFSNYGIFTKVEKARFGVKYGAILISPNCQDPDLLSGSASRQISGFFIKFVLISIVNEF